MPAVHGGSFTSLCNRKAELRRVLDFLLQPRAGDR